MVPAGPHRSPAGHIVNETSQNLPLAMEPGQLMRFLARWLHADHLLKPESNRETNTADTGDGSRELPGVCR